MARFLTGMEKHSEAFDGGKLWDGKQFFDSMFKNMSKWVSAFSTLWRVYGIQSAPNLRFPKDMFCDCREKYNHKFWQKFRKSVKEANPQALIFAEHYGSLCASFGFLNLK